MFVFNNKLQSGRLYGEWVRSAVGVGKPSTNGLIWCSFTLHKPMMCPLLCMYTFYVPSVDNSPNSTERKGQFALSGQTIFLTHSTIKLYMKTLTKLKFTLCVFSNSFLI